MTVKEQGLPVREYMWLNFYDIFQNNYGENFWRSTSQSLGRVNVKHLSLFCFGLVVA